MKKVILLVSIIVFCVFITICIIKNDKKPNEINALEKANKQITELTQKITDMEHKEKTYELMKFINPELAYQDMENINKALKEAKQTKLDDQIILALCSIESGLNKKQVSSTDDHGLCQINRATYNYLANTGKIKKEWEKIYEVDYNISVAILILKLYRAEIEQKYPKFDKKFIDIALLSSYNKGIRGMQKQLMNGDTYVEKVMNMNDKITDKKEELKNTKKI
jgi:soluble lytic murein transglycosylase-like protein